MRRRIGVFLALSLSALRAFAALNGSVMTWDGQPVAGARVSLYALESTEARRARLLSANPEAVPLVSTQTDAKGAFSLESPKEAVTTLWVYARGYAPVTRRVERDEEVGAIALSKAEVRTGTISGNGKPVANATVALQYVDGDYVARTNAEGRYEAPDPKNAVGIVVAHPDFALEQESFIGGPSGTSASKLTRTLSPGKALTGRVLGASGETPAAGATIYLDGWPAGTSGEDGAFTIAHASSRWSMLTARKDNLIVQRAASKEASYTLKLAKGSTISGRVTDAKTKAIVAGATVRVGPRRFGPRNDNSTMVLADAKGAYSIVVPAGTYTITPSHPAYDSRDADAAVTAGQQVAKDVTMQPLARVSGVVLDEEKRPVPAASIAAQPVEEISMGPMRFRGPNSAEGAISGPDGRFSGRVQSDEEIVLRATKRGLPQVKSEAMKLAPGERKTGLVLTIPSGIAVSGRVTDAQGKPLSGATITAAEVENTGMRMMIRTFIAGGPSNDEEAVRSASDGTFTMRVKEGTYDFTIRREGYAPKIVRGHAVTAASHEAVEAALDPAVEITGRITRGGNPVENARIFALGSTGEGNGVSGPDGSFVVSGLSAGPTRLMIRKEDDFVQDTRMITAPARDVAIELPNGGRVTGRVVEKGTNKPITTFQAGISISRSGGGMVMMAPPQLRDFTTDDGSFVLENVPAGGMVLVANSPGYSAGRMNVQVEEGKTLSDVVIELDTGVKLTGRVTGNNGAPLSDVSVRIMPSPTGGFATSGAERSATTDSNGEYTIDSLEPGDETVMFSHAKHAGTRKSVTLKGRETRLDVQLSSGQVVKGTVVTEAGAPVADASVDVVSAGGSYVSARTNASGAFEVEGLNPGRYRFSASRTGYADGIVEDVDISSGAPVRITLRTGGTLYGRVTGLTPAELESTQVEARSGRASAVATVDRNGNYRIEGAPTGTVQVNAQVLSRSRSFKSSSAQTVTLEAGGSQQVDINFRGDIVIRGRVTRNGKPLPNASITFIPKGTSQRGVNSGSTDEQGMYSIDGVDEGDYTVMVNDQQRFSPHATQYTVRGSDTFDINYKTAALRGRVVDATTNEPISNAEVQVRTTMLENVRIPRSAITDSTGSFVLDSVSAGTYTLTAVKESYGNQIQEIVVTESGVDNVELRMSKNSGITLKVVDARDGRPINATVFVYDTAGRLAHEPRMMFGGGSDDADVKLPVAPGSYVLSISAMNYAPQNVQLQSPAAHTVRLTPGGQLHIASNHSERRRYRILDASGLPYNRISSIPPVRDLLPSPGITTLQNVAPGTYTLQLLGQNDAVVDTQQVTVVEGQTTRAEL